MLLWLAASVVTLGGRGGQLTPLNMLTGMLLLYLGIGAVLVEPKSRRKPPQT